MSQFAVAKVDSCDDMPEIHPGNGAWQLVGFPWHEAVGINGVLNNQSTSPQIIKNFDQLWTPDGEGTLEYIVPGKGYFIK